MSVFCIDFFVASSRTTATPTRRRTGNVWKSGISLIRQVCDGVFFRSVRRLYVTHLYIQYIIRSKVSFEVSTTLKYTMPLTGQFWNICLIPPLPVRLHFRIFSGNKYINYTT